MNSVISSAECAPPSRLVRSIATGLNEPFMRARAYTSAPRESPNRRSFFERARAIGVFSVFILERARGRPKGKFTQHRRLDRLREILEKHPRGISLYDLAD